MKYFVLFLLVFLSGCPTKTMIRGDSTVVQLDTSETTRLALNFIREVGKLQAKASDASLSASARMDAQRQLDALNSSLAVSIQMLVDSTAGHYRLVYQQTSDSKTLVYLEPIRTSAVQPGMVSP